MAGDSGARKRARSEGGEESEAAVAGPVGAPRREQAGVDGEIDPGRGRHSRADFRGCQRPRLHHLASRCERQERRSRHGLRRARCPHRGVCVGFRAPLDPRGCEYEAALYEVASHEPRPAPRPYQVA